MIQPAQIDLTIYQGATFRMPIQWKAGEDAETAVPVNITGAKGRMQIRKNKREADYFIELTTENGRIDVADPENGLFYMQICSQDTAALNFKRGVYDLELIFGEHQCEVYRIAQGSVTLIPEITR